MYRHTKTARLMLYVTMLLGICLTGSGQKLLFQHLGTEQGLIQSNITHITQDKKGNIWIATNAGISVFDGKKFTNYDDLQNLSSLWINNIVCDHRGVVWIATDNGLLKYDKKFNLVFSGDAPFKRIIQLAVDKDNNKYFIYNKETYKISDTSNTAIKWNFDIPSRSPVVVLSVDPDNNLWVGTANAEAYRISEGKAIRLKVEGFAKHSKGTSPLSYFNITSNNPNTISFSSTKGIFIVENDTLVHIRDKYMQIPERSRTNCITRTSQQHEWIGSDSGVFKVAGDGKLKQFTKTNGFTNNSVTCIFEDAERNLWFGTHGAGVIKLSTEAVSLYDQVEQIDLSNIQSIAKTAQGDVILGSYSQGVIRMRGQHFTKNPFSVKPVFFRYVTGVAAKSQYTFIGTFGQGIFEYDNRSSTMKPAKLGVQENFINALLPYNQGFLVFAGGRFLYSFDNNYSLVARKEMAGLTSLFILSDSTFLFIQNGKVDAYDAQLNLRTKGLMTEIHSRLSCIEFYSNYMLVGTIGEGLLLYDKDFHFIKKLPSRSNIIYSLKVSANHLFIGSNVGLSKVPILGFPSIDNAAEKIIFSGECKEEGILSLNDDTILVTSSKGLYVINSKQDDFNFTKPTLTIQKLAFKNNTSQLASEFTDSIQFGRNSLINIPYNKNELVVSLKGVSQSSPGLLRYHFILQNYEDKWNTTDNGELIRYTNLPPGKYVFKARLLGKNSATPIAEIPFTIGEPLQATWWFQVLIFLLFIAFAVLLLKIFNRFNQRYIQTKWIDKSSNELQAKKTLIGQLVKSTKNDLENFKSYFIRQQKSETLNTDDPERFLDFYFKTTINRLDLIWEKEHMNLDEINETLKTFAQSSFDKAIEISHTGSNASILIPSEKAEKIIRLFSLFVFYSVHTNHARHFALTSKVRLGSQLFLKIYSGETVNGAAKNSIHHHLQNSIRELNNKEFSIEFIESKNLGNMIILSLVLEPNHPVENDFQ